jgi:LemA protein
MDILNLAGAMGTIGMIVLVIVGLFVLIAVFWAIGNRNNFVTMTNNVDEGFATIDVYLKKRYDLIPNLLETVKGYMKHEKGTFEAVVKARSAAMSAGPEDKAQAENMLSGTLKTLFALAENYPELKADKQFAELSSELKAIETELAQARKYYNAVVKEYNTKRETIPSSIIASMFNFEKKPMFEVTDVSQRENVKVEF